MKKILCMPLIAFGVWFAASYIEILSKNLEGCPLSFWNIFTVFM